MGKLRGLTPLQYPLTLPHAPTPHGCYFRHNRARGVHGVVPMADMVATLITQGWTDTDIAKELGMDADEVLRFKQNIGLPKLFKGHEFSPSWE